MKTQPGSLMTKIVGIACLILFLQVPIGFIGSLVSERTWSRDMVTEQLAALHGLPQTIRGPILSIPCRKKIESESECGSSRAITPEQLKVKGKVAVQGLNRGLYTIPVYTTQLEISAVFLPEAIKGLELDRNDLSNIRVGLGLGDLKGLRQVADLMIGEKSQPFTPKEISIPEASQTLGSEPFDAHGLLQEPLTVKINLELAGTSQLMVVPVAKETNVELSSNWPHPKFDGTYLPITRRVTSDGFEASWKVLDYSGDMRLDSKQLLGTTFVQPVDDHRMTNRALKYELLLFALTFLAFWIFEVTARIQVHPFQYLLVGAALSVYYLLLLSLAEQIGFGLAYLVASATITAIITGYSISVLKAARRAYSIALLLSSTYGFLYTLLSLEDYALLVGSCGLTAIVAGLMYLTRNINWYKPVIESGGQS